MPPEDTPEKVAARPAQHAAPKRPVGRPRKELPAGKTDTRVSPPKISAPNFTEWHDFIGNFAIKWIARAYIAFVFRGIDRWELLSPQDNEALELDDQQLSDMAKPLAHIATRSKFLSRRGRAIIDSADGVAAAIQFAMWANRVNRIAKKVRPVHEHRVVPGRVEPNTGSGPASEAESGGNVPQGPAFSPNGNAPGYGYN